MKKRLLSVLFAVCMVMAILPAAYAAGDITSINSAADLIAFAEDVNEGSTYEGKTVTLTKNITLSVEDWTSIGNGTRDGSGYTGNAFKGTFNGNNKTITGLSIKTGTTAGLFGVVDGGTVKNLTLTNVKIDVSANEEKDNVGAAVALMVNGGTVENVKVSGSVSGYYNAGGVVGTMTIDGSVTGCTNSAAVSGKSAGGIVGKAYYSAVDKAMAIFDCVNSGTVSSNTIAGGIVGFSAANVSGCSNSGAIKGATEAGGIVGEQTMYGTISGNANSGVISNNGTGGTAYGGIVGWARYNNSTIDYPLHATIIVSGNTNSGKISASGASLGSGGIVGSAYNQATVTGNTNTAASITGGTFAAGIVGGPQFAANNVQISGETITVTNNISTTSLSAISANCKDLYMYNNAADTFKAEYNSDTWVAKIGSDKYTTLQAAVDAAGEGGTVVLMANVTLSESVLVEAGQKVTLNLNGYTISQTKEQTKAYSMITNKGDLTIMDGSSKKTGKISYTDSGLGGEYVSNTIQNSGKLTVESGTIENLSSEVVAKAGYPQAIDNSGSLTVKGGAVYSAYYSAIRIWCTTDDDTAVVIEGGTITGAVDLHNVNGNANKGTLSVTGGTFKKGLSETLNGSRRSLRLVNFGSDIDELSINVSGGTFEGDMWLSGSVTTVDLADVLTITGGTYSTDVTEYCAEGYKATKSGSSYKVGEMTAATLDDLKFSTLKAALEAAMDGDTIKLADNITLKETLVVDKKVTLNLNGYTISGTSDVQGHSMIINKGDLTIKDTSSKKTGLITYTFTGTPDTSFGKGNYTITNSGKLTLESGTIENNTAKMSHMRDAIDNNSGTGDAVVVINGGKVVDHTYIAIRQFANSTTYKNDVIVNGGVVEGGVRAIWMQLPGSSASSVKNASLTVTDGTLTSNDTDYNLAVYVYSYGDSAANTKINISGGTINGDVAINGKACATLAEGNLAVTGGTFNGAYGVFGYEEIPFAYITGGTYTYDVTEYCPEGYSAKEAKGVWTVEEDKVAKIGSKTYPTLQAAVDAAGLDSTIVLMEDITLTKPIVVGADKWFTLNLAGYTISQTNEQTGAYSMITNKGDLTIMDSKSTGKISYIDSGAGGEYVSNTIQNSGKLTVESGTIENLSSEAVAKAGYPQAIDNSGSLTVKGGAVYSAYYSAIRIWCTTDDDTSVVIKGGTITGAVDLHNVNGNANKGTLTVTDGTFKKGLSETLNGSRRSLRLVNFGSDIDELSINVTGGTFEGDMWLSGSVTNVDLAEVLTISGGTYSTDISAYVAEGFAAVKAEDKDVWTIKDLRVIELNGELYASLQAAFDAAKDGDTVVLKDDITIDETVFVFKSVTLNGGGFEIVTAVEEDESGFNAFVVAAPVKFTVQNLKMDVPFETMSAITVSLHPMADEGTTEILLKSSAITADYIVYNFEAQYADVQIVDCDLTATGTGALVFAGSNHSSFFVDSKSTVVLKSGCLVYFSGEESVGNSATIMTKSVTMEEGTNLVTGAAAITQNVYYQTLGDAIAAAKTGSTVTLLADATIDEKLTIEKKLTLDLNGYDIDMGENQIIVHNGKLDITGEGVISTSIAENTAFWVRGSAKNTSNYSVLTIGEKVTVNAPNSYGAAINRAADTNNAYGAVVTVDGTINSKYGVYVSGNVHANTGNVPKMIINGTVNADDVALYGAGYAEYIVNGALVGGVGGVEIRAGELTVNEGAVITSNGAFTDPVPNFNGTTAVGAAIVVSQHGTNLPIIVNVEGGTISGEYAFFEIDTVESEEAPSEGVEIAITGGTFTGKVGSINKTAFISGGTFSESLVESDLLAATVNAETMNKDENDSIINYSYFTSYSAAKKVAAVENINDFTQKTVEIQVDGEKITALTLKLGEFDVNGVEKEEISALVNAVVWGTESGKEAFGASIVEWKSSNSDVADFLVDEEGNVVVDTDGNVTIIAKKAGKTTISATSNKGKTVKVTATVTQLPTENTLTGADNVLQGGSVTIKSDLKVNWSIDPAVEGVSISTSGKVTVGNVDAGTEIVVCASAKDNEYLVVKHTLTVVPVASKIEISGAPEDTWDVKDISTLTLSAVVYNSNEVPGEIVDPTITWTSSNQNVATVDPDTGVVTAVKSGTVTITASGHGKSAKVTLKVTIVPTVITVSASDLVVTTDKEINADQGTSQTLYVDVKRSDDLTVSSKAVTWAITKIVDGKDHTEYTTESDNFNTIAKKYATISTSGKLTVAKTAKAGSVITVTVTAKGNTDLVGTYTVTVKPVVGKLGIVVGDATTASTKYAWAVQTIDGTKTDTLKAVLFDLAGESMAAEEDMEITWKTAKKAYVSFGEDSAETTGESISIYAEKKGSSKITVKAGSKTAYCTVTVSQQSDEIVTTMKNPDDPQVIYLGKTLTMKATAAKYAETDENKKSNLATNKAVTWEVKEGEAEGILTISPSGLVKTSGVGTVTVVAVAKDGGATREFVIKVVPKLNKVTLDESSFEIPKGEKWDITGVNALLNIEVYTVNEDGERVEDTLTAAEAEVDKIEYKISSGSSYVKYDKDAGTLEAVKNGSAKLTITVTYGGISKSVTCTLKVVTSNAVG